MCFQKVKEARIPKIVHHQLVCGGEARLSGTRVCVWNIIWHLNHDRTTEELLEDFPRLTLTDIEVAKKYYWDNKQEIDYEIYIHSQDLREMKEIPSFAESEESSAISPT